MSSCLPKGLQIFCFCDAEQPSRDECKKVEVLFGRGLQPVQVVLGKCPAVLGDAAARTDCYGGILKWEIKAKLSRTCQLASEVVGKRFIKLVLTATPFPASYLL